MQKPTAECRPTKALRQSKSNKATYVWACCYGYWSEDKIQARKQDAEQQLCPFKQDFIILQSYYCSDDLLLCLGAFHINRKISDVKVRLPSARYFTCCVGLNPLIGLDWIQSASG